MKLILDFDGVFFDTAKLKERFFSAMKQYDVLNTEEKYYFERANDRPFSLVLFITRLCKKTGMDEMEAEAIYGEIMDACGDFVNDEVVQIMESVGRESCFLVTNGEEEFQKDKIERSGARDLVQEVIIVPGTKKFAVERLCARFPDETIIFVDDKERFLEDIDTVKYGKIKTILYDKDGVSRLKAVIEESR